MQIHQLSRLQISWLSSSNLGTSAPTDSLSSVGPCRRWPLACGAPGCELDLSLGLHQINLSSPRAPMAFAPCGDESGTMQTRGL